jgi:hypothetical protein
VEEREGRRGHAGLSVPMLLWLLALACHTPPREAPTGEVALGWRLAPGMELAYRLRSTHTLGADVVERVEVWHYLVRRVDDQGTFSLEGHLESLDATIVAGGVPVDEAALAEAVSEERARLEQGRLSLSLSIDGRIDQLEAGTWSDALSHRLLALRFPAEPIPPGERWNDAETARAFTGLIPPGVEQDVTGTQRLEQLVWHPVSSRPLVRERILVAEIETQAMVRPEDARLPALDIQGQARWDLEAGHLLSRDLVVTERGGDDPDQAGMLALELQWVAPQRVHTRR